MLAKLKNAEDNFETPKFMKGLGGLRKNKISNLLNPDDHEG